MIVDERGWRCRVPNLIAWLTLVIGLGLGMSGCDGGESGGETPKTGTTTALTSSPATAAQPTTKPIGPAVDITSHQDGQSVQMSVVIRGTSQELGRAPKIWIVLIPQGINRYYPQDGPVSVQPDGDWSSPPVFIGNEKDAGKSFDVLAVVTNKQGEEDFAKYLEDGNRTGDFPGLEKLPPQPQAVEYDRVTVTRQ